jgi:hypothetical protein
VRGEKLAHLAHLLGRGYKNPCKNASTEAIECAEKLAGVGHFAPSALPSSATSTPAPSAATTPRSSSGSISVTPQLGQKRSLTQSTLLPHVFAKNDMPFSTRDQAAIREQVLKATISANISFRAWENPEMLALFGMLRSRAPDIIPTAKEISGSLLTGAANKVESNLKLLLNGRSVTVR